MVVETVFHLQGKFMKPMFKIKTQNKYVFTNFPNLIIFRSAAKVAQTSNGPILKQVNENTAFLDLSTVSNFYLLLRTKRVLSLHYVIIGSFYAIAVGSGGIA